MSSIFSVSINHPLADKMKLLSFQSKPVVEISLHGETDSYTPSYSNLDKLEGHVSIVAPHDTRFDELEIALLGASSTYVDKFNMARTMSARTDANLLFLKLHQPMSGLDLPSPRILEAGRTYRFPFTFVIPAQLLPRAFQRYANQQVRTAHLQLPPSMGGSSVSGHGGKLLDDLAPEMAKVDYRINVLMTRDVAHKSERIVESSKRVRIKPAVEEQPPLVMDPRDNTHRMREEKMIRKGMLKGKLGRLIMTTQQPRGFRLPGPRSTNNEPISSSTKITLRFDPADDTYTPPKLGSLASRLRATTFYSTTPRTNFPHRDTALADFTQGFYYEIVTLSTRCMAAAQWEKHSLAAAASSSVLRRDSGCSCSTDDPMADSSNAGHPAASSTYKPHSTFYYTTTLLVPLTLPTNKTWLPTFHSCLHSRVYRLDLVLSINATTSLSLKVPIQISAAGSVEGDEERVHRAEEAAELQRRLVNEDSGLEAWLVDNSNDGGVSRSGGALQPAFEGVNAVERRRGSREEDSFVSLRREPPAYSALPQLHSRDDVLSEEVVFLALS